jgi:DNA-binding transcriptional LysR family regulator
MAQPPLSQQILGLEEELGVALFKRSNRHVELTAAGEALMLHARRVLNAASEAIATVHAVRDGRRGRISVGAVYSAIYTLMPDTLRAFAVSHPDVDVHIHEMTIPEQIKGLREGVIDLAVLRGPVSDPEIVTEFMYADPLIAALPNTCPLAAKERVSLEEMAAYRLIAISPNFNRHYSDLVYGMFEKAQCMPQSLQAVSSMHKSVVPGRRRDRRGAGAAVDEFGAIQAARLPTLGRGNSSIYLQPCMAP